MVVPDYTYFPWGFRKGPNPLSIAERTCGLEYSLLVPNDGVEEIKRSGILKGTVSGTYHSKRNF